MITVKNDYTLAPGGSVEQAIDIASDLPSLAAFHAKVTPEEWRQFVRQIRQGWGDLDSSNYLKAEIYR